MKRIWIDVEDIFAFFEAGGRRPSGIQRVVAEICRAFHSDHAESGEVNLVRHDAQGLLRKVPWGELSALFEALASAPYEPPPPPVTARVQTSNSPVYVRIRAMLSRLPPRTRFPIMRFGRAQLDAISALRDLGIRDHSPVLRRLRRQSADLAASQRAAFAADVAPGDVVLMLGAAWLHPEYGEHVARFKRRYSVRFALLVHDIIPLRRPEWVPRGASQWFSTSFGRLLAECDCIFASSQAAARDVENYARETDLKIALPVNPIPFGSGFSSEVVEAPLPPYLLPTGDYVLFVSTIEVRKNHALLLRVWRRLLEEMPREDIPTLVFVGRNDASVVDVPRQLMNSDYLDGKIMHIAAASDAELAALYRGCLFTVFPSFYEGWGLPVTESLAFGKPCIVSNATSLPEAGGSMARYFDPEDGTEAYRLIREAIEDRAGLQLWRERVAAEFRPVSWRQTARALADALSVTSALAA